MNRTRLVLTFVLTTLAACVASSLAGAGPTANLPPPGACPAEPAKAPTIKFAVSYSRRGTLVGATYCNDGASAKATLAGQTYSFKKGVCYRQGGEFSVKIGTFVQSKRQKSDPPGFGLSDFPSGGFTKDGVWFGLTKAGKVVHWSFGDVKVTPGRGSAPKGTFSGVWPTLVNGKLTEIPAKGSFACKRVLRLPG